MSLVNAAIGTEVKIRKIDIISEVREFLNTLGFNEGENITVISANCGNLIVNVKNTRIAIGKSLALKILL